LLVDCNTPYVLEFPFAAKDLGIYYNLLLGITSDRRMAVISITQAILNSSDKQNMLGLVNIDPPGMANRLDAFSYGSNCFEGAFSKGNRAFALVCGGGSNAEIRVYNISTRECVRRWSCPNAQAVAWSPIDGRLLVGGGNLLRLYQF
jgi:hypothetical protein